MNKQTEVLSEVHMHKKAVVVLIESNKILRRRFFDLGIIEDTIIEPLFKSPMGDPTAYLIRGAVIALRSDEAEYIRVSLL
ncbi:FeoA family protein [Clostridium sp. BJN0001]|uniref:FeoA family protein n=1 Tax=Clostridium sp. BJN0001 TaxID=2930219 RepID=UPI001FD210FA|nr:FeoA family protein [Clostridium sp. BJN0001]